MTRKISQILFLRPNWAKVMLVNARGMLQKDGGGDICNLRCIKSATAKISIEQHLHEWVYYERKQLYFAGIFASLLRSQLLKKGICSSRSKFFPFRVDLFSKC